MQTNINISFVPQKASFTLFYNGLYFRIYRVIYLLLLLNHQSSSDHTKRIENVYVTVNVLRHLVLQSKI